jgi:hypothetical protein
MKQYETEILVKLAAAMRDEEDSAQWLRENGFRELVEFREAYEHIEKSFRWLLENNFRELAALVDALHGNDQAKLWLIKSGCVELAAMVDASDGNKSAMTMLANADQKGWIAVAREIYLSNQQKEKKSFWHIFSFGNPFQ